MDALLGLRSIRIHPRRLRSCVASGDCNMRLCLCTASRSRSKSSFPQQKNCSMYTTVINTPYISRACFVTSLSCSFINSSPDRLYHVTAQISTVASWLNLSQATIFATKNLTVINSPTLIITSIFLLDYHQRDELAKLHIIQVERYSPFQRGVHS